MKAAKQQERPATGGQIRDILGPDVHDSVIARVLRTGADADEIMQAREWLNDDDYVGAGLQRTMQSRIHSVYDILMAERGNKSPAP